MTHSVIKTRKDSYGRIWSYCDGDGSWSYGNHSIGCAAKNGGKFMIWGGLHRSLREFKTLRDAMESCWDE